MGARKTSMTVAEAKAQENPNGAAGELADRQALAYRVLGKGVHRAAINRLFELWPEAQVEVRHERGLKSYTYVRIWTGEKNDSGPNQHNRADIECHSTTHPDDQFSRRRGIAVAFGRCVHAVSAFAKHQALMQPARERLAELDGDEAWLNPEGGPGDRHTHPPGT